MLLIGVLAVGTIHIAAQVQPDLVPHFAGLGDLPGGYFHSVPLDVSDDGSVVIGYSHSVNGTEAFRWTRFDGPIGIGFPHAYAVSADGSRVVGYRHLPGGAEPVLWKQGGGLVGLGKLASEQDGAAYAISADCAVIVGTYDSGVKESGFRWTAQRGIEHLRGPRALNVRGTVWAISADGVVLVGASRNPAGRDEAFRWTAETGLEHLGVLPDHTTSTARAISADGSVIVGCSSDGARTTAFRWTKQTGIVALDTFPGSDGRYAIAMDVSAGGSIIVGQCRGQNGSEAFVWDARSGMRSVRDVLVSEYGLKHRLHSWKLVSANAVSADGRTIVGSGVNPSCNREGWIVQLRSTINHAAAQTQRSFAAGERDLSGIDRG